jgi:peptidoglycan/LPS O-acetylase OafA/YrhL
MSWAGVDLFFVLSGYLVSGLLFREYQHYSRVDAWRFLIRRGFKIYPLFYLLLPVAFAIQSAIDGPQQLKGLLIEASFVQNYFYGRGCWPYFITWSLAVEEHFYLFLTLVVVVAVRLQGLASRWFLGVLGCFVLICPLMRYFAFGSPYYSHEENTMLIYTSTHFRVDGLIFGVLIAWFHCFRKDWIVDQVARWGSLFPWVALALLSFTPFLPLNSRVVLTLGLSMVDAGFALLLLWVLFKKPVPEVPAMRWMAHIGRWSYGIYLSHVFVIRWFLLIPQVDDLIGGSIVTKFPVYFILGIGLGAFLTTTVEQWGLRVRDRYFPSRSPASVTVAQPIAGRA